MPHCADCGDATFRVVSKGEGHVFLCASCEYLRANPEAPKAIKMPRERRALPLQSEKLFEPL